MPFRTKCLFLAVINFFSIVCLGQTSNCFETCFAVAEQSTKQGRDRHQEIFNTLIGCQAPNFKLRSLNGKEISLLALRGKVIVMNFWSDGCAPCRYMIPSLNKLAVEYAKLKEVVFIGFSRDDAITTENFIYNNPFQFIIVPTNEKFFETYCVIGQPLNIILDKNGRVQYLTTGGAISGGEHSDDAYRDMKPVIEKLLL